MESSMSSASTTRSENYHPNKMLEELEKLRNANRLAEELLTNISHSTGNQPPSGMQLLLIFE